MRVAFASMASKTGASSPGELLITFSTSAVAVCCCSDFPQLVEQPRVLDGDDGLGGEILDQLNLPISEGYRPTTGSADRPDHYTSPNQRHGNL